MAPKGAPIKITNIIGYKYPTSNPNLLEEWSNKTINNQKAKEIAIEIIQIVVSIFVCLISVKQNKYKTDNEKINITKKTTLG